jgi:hypothetical protein
VTDLDARLEHALKAVDPAPRDPMFRVEILARRERAAFRRRVLGAVATALAAAILAPLGLAAISEVFAPGALQLAAVAAAGAGLMAFLTAPHLGMPVRSLARLWRPGSW